MKKITTAVFAAGLVLSATACTATTQLSTAETCERVQTVLANPGNNVGKTGATQLANQIRPIETVASDELKTALASIIEYTDEASKAEPDEDVLTGLSEAYAEATSTFTASCS